VREKYILIESLSLSLFLRYRNLNACFCREKKKKKINSDISVGFFSLAHLTLYQATVHIQTHTKLSVNFLLFTPKKISFILINEKIFFYKYSKEKRRCFWFYFFCGCKQILSTTKNKLYIIGFFFS
jgi:hypothetical protein